MRALRTRQDLDIDVNGENRRVAVVPGELLLWTLRDGLGLTGAKPGCENGDCGACTVLLDGRPVKSCLVFTAEVGGRPVTTVEGLRGSPLQQAFVEHGAFQCGYCTSGFLMVARALLLAHPQADEATLVDWLRANICRCTGYQEILAAVRAARDAQAGGAGGGDGASGHAGAEVRAPVPAVGAATSGPNRSGNGSRPRAGGG